MKLSEVYKSKKWINKKLFDDYNSIGACCLLGGCVVADNLDASAADHGGGYTYILQNSPIAQKLAKFLKEKYPEYSQERDSDIIWIINDKYNSFEEVEKLIQDFEATQETKETKMATMNDVAGHNDLTDDDVYEALENFLDGGNPFTAYDVTQKLRADGFWAEHSSVKDLVHDYAQTNGISWQNKEIKTGVYARSYRPNQAVVSGGANYAAQPSVTQNLLPPTKRGGVSIPASLVRQLGLTPGNTVAVTKKKNELIVSSDKLSLDADYKYTVDNGNRVVITRKALRDAGFTTNKISYTISGFALKLSQ